MSKPKEKKYDMKPRHKKRPKTWSTKPSKEKKKRAKEKAKAKT